MIAEHAAGEGINRAEVVEDLGDELGSVQLPLLLIDLDDLTLSAASRAALRLLGAAPAAVVGRPIVGTIVDERQADAVNALHAIRSGTIDFYRARLPLRGRTVPADRVVTVWVRRVRFGERDVALVELAKGGAQQRSPLAEYFGQEPLAMAVGTVDPDWVIRSMSADAVGLLGLCPEDAIGRQFLCSVDQDDVRRILQAGRDAGAERSVALRVRLRDGSGDWRQLCCVVTSLGGTPDLCFLLMPEDMCVAGGESARVARLEQHLWRIAAEVEASGLLQHIGKAPDPARFPQMRSLTARQWEVLSRLMSGERVPTIAAELFLSQSTVRNHLAAIFERFGVHSQAELIAMLASAPTDDSPA